MPPSYQHVVESASNRAQSDQSAHVFQRDDSIVVALADGCRGIRGGVAASRAFLAAVKAAVNDRSFGVDDVRYWVDLLLSVDRALADNRLGETSAVVAAVDGGRLVGVSAGDGTALNVTTSRVDDLTVGRHANRPLGSGSAVAVPFECPALTGSLLVASSALFKCAAIEVIARIVRASPICVAIEELIELIRLPSGRFAEDAALVLVSGSPSSSRLS